MPGYDIVPGYKIVRGHEKSNVFLVDFAAFKQMIKGNTIILKTWSRYWDALRCMHLEVKKKMIVIKILEKKDDKCYYNNRTIHVVI